MKEPTKTSLPYETKTAGTEQANILGMLGRILSGTFGFSKAAACALGRSIK